MIGRLRYFPLLFLALAGHINAGTILDVDGPNNWAVNPASNPDADGVYAFLFASWTQTIGYSGVDISIFGNGVTPTAAGTAYLTAEGPGTTMANEFAVTAFSAPDAPASWIPLFSGLTLGPGTYYVMIFADPGSQIAWIATSPDTATVTLGPGVTLTQLYDGTNTVTYTGSTYAAYPPATDGVGFQDNLLIDVTSAPEPATLSYLCSAGAAVLLLSRRSRERATS